MTRAIGRPSAAPKASASPTAWLIPASMTWLTALVAWPVRDNYALAKAAVAELQKRLAQQRVEIKKHKATIDAFVAKHGIKSEQTLRQKSVQWTLLNPHVATVCVSMNDFETMDSFIPLAGTKLAQVDAQMLEDPVHSLQPCRQ